MATKEDTTFTPNANILPPSSPNDHSIKSTGQLRENDAHHHDHGSHGSHKSSTLHEEVQISPKVKKLTDLKPVPLEPMIRFAARKRKESIAYSVISAVSLIYEDLAKGAQLAT